MSYTGLLLACIKATGGGIHLPVSIIVELMRPHAVLLEKSLSNQVSLLHKQEFHLMYQNSMYS